MAAVAVVVVLALLLALAFALLTWAGRRGWPRRKTIALFPALAVSVLAVLLVVAWATDEPRLRAECGSFRFQPADWRNSSSDTRLRAAEAVARCGVLRQRPASEVAQLLGPPDSKGLAEYEPDSDKVWFYGDVGNERDSETGPHNLSVFFRGRRVSFARFSAQCC